MAPALPYKIVDRTGQNRFGIVVSSLEALMKKGQEKFGMPLEIMKVVLENDGTEIDEEEYFNTLEPNTSFVIMKLDEEWIPPSQYNYVRHISKVSDELDGSSDPDLAHLLCQLRGDAGMISFLGAKELEALSDMDPENLRDIIPDREFLGGVKEASCRFLNDKREAQEALQLLKVYKAASNTMIGKGYADAATANHFQ